MAFKNSLKIYLEKGFFSFAGRRLASGPPAEAGPARQRSPRAAPAHLASAQPSALAPSPARRARRRATPRPRQDALAAWRPCVGVARRAAATPCARAHAPAFNCRSQCTRSLPPALPSLSSRAESPSSAPRRAYAPAGEIRRGSSTSAGNRAPAALPRPPSSRARACAAFRAQVEPPRASPPTAMAPPCSAAMEVDFLLFSSPA